MCNVRLTLAQVIVKHLQKNGYFSKDEQIQGVIKKLKYDTYYEVRATLKYQYPDMNKDFDEFLKNQNEITQQQYFFNNQYSPVLKSQKKGITVMNVISKLERIEEPQVQNIVIGSNQTF